MNGLSFIIVFIALAIIFSLVIYPRFEKKIKEFETEIQRRKESKL